MTHLDTMTLGNAAGMVKWPHEAEPLLRSGVTRIGVGSLCKLGRTEHLGRNYYFNPATSTSYNSKGLPSPSMDYSLEWLPDFMKKCEDAEKELEINFAAFSPVECGELAERCAPYAHVLTWNGGCGNVWKDNQQKPIPSYHPQLLGDSLWEIRKRLGGNAKIAVKVSPVEDMELLRQIALVMQESGIVGEVIAVNTKPNQRGLQEDGATEALAWRESEDADVKHTGGMGGAALKKDGLRVVKELSILLPSARIIGCGGIFTGHDVLEYMEAGAIGAQLGTAFCQEGPRIFSRVIEEATDIEEHT